MSHTHRVGKWVQMGEQGEEEKRREERRERDGKEVANSKVFTENQLASGLHLTSKRMGGIISFPQWDGPSHSYH